MSLTGVLALAACGDGEDTTAAPTTRPTATPTATPTTTPTATPSLPGGSGATPSPTRTAARRSPTATARTTTSAPRRPPPARPPAGTADFVRVVRAQLSDVASGRSDREIGDIAVRACKGLSGGAGSDEIVAQAQSLGTLDANATDAATARELVKLAIDTVCLDQAGRVDEF